MRLTVPALTFAAALAAGCHAVAPPDNIPGYEAIPLPDENKYGEAAALSARSVDPPKTDLPIPGFIPLYASDSLEPTHMPEEDLQPTANIHARSVPEEGSSDSPDEDYPDSIEDTEDERLQNLMARSLPEEDEPTVPFHYEDDDEPMSHEIYTRSLDDLEEMYPEWDVPFEGTEDSVPTVLHRRSVPDEEDEEYYPYSSEDEAAIKKLLAHSEFDVDEDIEANLAKRSEDDDDDYVDTAHPNHDLDFEKRSLDEEDYLDHEVIDEDEGAAEYAEFEEAAEPTPEPTPSPPASDAPAAPAAAPTPKPTSADTVSTPSPTTASQWSDVISETAASASSTLSKLLGRSVHSRPRFHHHYTVQAASGGPAASSTPASKTGARGLFNFLW